MVACPYLHFILFIVSCRLDRGYNQKLHCSILLMLLSVLLEVGVFRFRTCCSNLFLCLVHLQFFAVFFLVRFSVL